MIYQDYELPLIDQVLGYLVTSRLGHGHVYMSVDNVQFQTLSLSVNSIGTLVRT